MQEELLHFIWKYRLWQSPTIRTTDGQLLEITQVGEHNHNAGPDFFNARLTIADTSWAGNVEIHYKSSDWHRHRHSLDKAYESVILHVVYEHDDQVQLADGSVLPTFELKPLVSPQLFNQYQVLMNSRDWIPCEQQLKQVPRFAYDNWLDRLVVERLQDKCQPIEDILEMSQNHWEQAFYIILAQSFGFKVNSEAFKRLAHTLPLTYLARHKDQVLQLEALLLGQAGFLEQAFKSTYPKQLQQEYQFLRQKYQLTPLAKHQWKFLRLRPSNFPTIRLAQFAQLIHRSSHLLSRIIETEKIEELPYLFAVKASAYWDTHYQLEKPSTKRPKQIGKMAIHHILINTIAPFLFLYGRKRHRPDIEERAVKLLEYLPPEKNSITRKWSSLNFAPESALQSQAQLQLKNTFCDQKRCLNCNLGNVILHKA